MAVNYSIKELKELSSLLTEKTGLAFHEITHSFLKRRLNQVMSRFLIKRTNQLLERLDDPQFREEFIEFFSVESTEMFRDAGMWRNLKQILLDCSSSPVNIWFPDVSSGEELYSLLVLVEEIKLNDPIKILANHCSSEGLRKVQSGIIEAKKWDINTHNYKRFEGICQLEDYFIKQEGDLKFRPDLLAKVEFKKNFILNNNSLIDKQDIVIYRNSLLIYSKFFKEDALNIIHNNLKSKGFLCIGIQEALPNHSENVFEAFDLKNKIFKKK